MTQLSIQQAADKVGVTRQTIYKKISDGVLSATIDRRGNKQIDVSELLRVYGNLSASDSQAKATVNKPRHVKTSSDTSLLHLELERAQMQLQLKEKELQMAEERIADLKAREAESKGREREALTEKQQLLAIIDRQTLLLAAPQPAKPAPRPAAKPKAAAKPVPKAKVATPAKKPVQARKTPAAKAPARSTSSKTLAKPAAAKKSVVKSKSAGSRR